MTSLNELIQHASGLQIRLGAEVTTAEQALPTILGAVEATKMRIETAFNQARDSSVRDFNAARDQAVDALAILARDIKGELGERNKVLKAAIDGKLNGAGGEHEET